ncbi:MAG: hypothetical protein FWG03_05595 [Clostridiales bacterium]|nr:hypothetical protein [Clostridiales bacterium]
MIFRPAAPSDGLEMLRLIESRPAAGGNLRILHTRRPDAYRSYKMECADAEMVLCTADDGRLLAQAVCLPRSLYINGEVCTAGYVTGLHIAQGARADIRKMLDAGYAHTRATRFFCSFLDSSRAAYDLFSKRGWVRPICGYTTYMLHPAAIKPVRHGFTFRRATPGDSERLLRFYNEFGPGYSYFPAFESLDSFPEPAVPDFFLFEDRGDIIAAGALWDQHAYKQYIVNGYGGAYRLAAFCNPVLRALHYPPLPKAGSPARFAYISFLLCRGGSPGPGQVFAEQASPGQDFTEQAFSGQDFIEQAFLGELSEAARGYDFLTVGAVNGTGPGLFLDSLRSIRIGSTICAIDYSGAGAGVKTKASAGIASKTSAGASAKTSTEAEAKTSAGAEAKTSAGASAKTSAGAAAEASARAATETTTPLRIECALL